MPTCPSCGHCWGTKPKRATRAGDVDLAALSDAELYAHYKKTSHIGDAEFLYAIVRQAIDPEAGPIAHDLWHLVCEAQSGLAKAETLRRLRAVQVQWFTRHDPAPDEARFWAQQRRLGARARGRAYREQRDRMLGHVADAANPRMRKTYYSPTPAWCRSATIEGLIAQVGEEVRDLVRAARAICPQVDRNAPAPPRLP